MPTQEWRPPRVLLSYSHDSPEHSARVLGLADRLRGMGVGARIDRYDPAPAEPWPRWMERELREADFVLVVSTARYALRSRGEEEPGRGLGATFECVLITQELYEAGMWNERFVPVAFSAEDASHIVTPLRGFTFYRVDTEEGYQQLYRRLTGQPESPAPPLGEKLELPPLHREPPAPAGSQAELATAQPPEEATPPGGGPPPEEPRSPKRWPWRFWLRHWKELLGSLAVVPILLGGLGFLVHRSRESLLGLEPGLAYPKEELLWAGVQALWGLLLSPFSLVVPGHPALGLAALALLLLSAGALLSARGVPAWLGRVWLQRAFLAALALVLALGLWAYSRLLDPPHSVSGPPPSFAAQPEDAAQLEVISWLENDDQRNRERRWQLFGLLGLGLLAAAGLAGASRRQAAPWPRWGLGLAGLLALGLAFQLPRAVALGQYGLIYPPVKLKGGPGCDEELKAALDQARCCAFDVGEGAVEHRLLLRGDGCPPGRGRFLAFSGERASCVEEAGNQRVGVHHGCG